jgi:hypothetical protein
LVFRSQGVFLIPESAKTSLKMLSTRFVSCAASSANSSKRFLHERSFIQVQKGKSSYFLTEDRNGGFPSGSAFCYWDFLRTRLAGDLEAIREAALQGKAWGRRLFQERLAEELG